MSSAVCNSKKKLQLSLRPFQSNNAKVIYGYAEKFERYLSIPITQTSSICSNLAFHTSFSFATTFPCSYMVLSCSAMSNSFTCRYKNFCLSLHQTGQQSHLASKFRRIYFGGMFMHPEFYFYSFCSFIKKPFNSLVLSPNLEKNSLSFAHEYTLQRCNFSIVRSNYYKFG
jgi:hypothetical protein